MAFDSFEFLFRFLPVFFILYYLAQPGYRNALLLVGSFVFYASGRVEHAALLAVCVLVNFCCARLMEKQEKARKFWLWAALTYDFGVLIFFKYTGLAGALPLGISFYTFQIPGYMMDVYRKKFPAEQSLLKLGTYLTMFSQLASGPIVNYGEIREALEERELSAEGLEEGLRMLILGLGAKVLVADRIGLLWNDIQTIGFASISTPLAWMGAFGYSLELYFDFAGYSMMAMGIGKMLGFAIPENFHFPYMSKSVTEFWRRWHITLGRWFREYVYIPLGGNRKGKARTFLNLIVVWSLTALWHGSKLNFLIWGGALLALMLVEKLFLFRFLDKSKVIGHLYVIFFLPLTWVAFAITDVQQLGVYFSRLFPFFGAGAAGVQPLDYVQKWQSYWPLFVAGILFSTPLPARLFEKIREKWTGAVCIVAVLAASVYYMTVSANNPFLYFSF